MRMMIQRGMRRRKTKKSILWAQTMILLRLTFQMRKMRMRTKIMVMSTMSLNKMKSLGMLMEMGSCHIIRISHGFLTMTILNSGKLQIGSHLKSKILLHIYRPIDRRSSSVTMRLRS